MYRTIVVGVNQIDSAQRAAEQAIALAEAFAADLHLVCAFGGKEAAAPLSAMVPGAALAGAHPSTTPPGQEEPRVHAEQFLESLARSTTARTSTHAFPGDPATAILQVADEVGADLIVVGNRGMHGARRALGSVPNTLSHHATCSVLIAQTT